MRDRDELYLDVKQRPRGAEIKSENDFICSNLESNGSYKCIKCCKVGVFTSNPKPCSWSCSVGDQDQTHLSCLILNMWHVVDNPFLIISSQCISSKVNKSVTRLFFVKGVLHTSRFGGSCAAVTQRDAAVWMRNLWENLRTRSELGSAQSGSLAGRPLNVNTLMHVWLLTMKKGLQAFSLDAEGPEHLMSPQRSESVCLKFCVISAVTSHILRRSRLKLQMFF